jgi:hypothetical protein
MSTTRCPAVDRPASGLVVVFAMLIDVAATAFAVLPTGCDESRR